MPDTMPTARTAGRRQCAPCFRRGLVTQSAMKGWLVVPCRLGGRYGELAGAFITGGDRCPGSSQAGFARLRQRLGVRHPPEAGRERALTGAGLALS